MGGLAFIISTGDSFVPQPNSVKLILSTRGNFYLIEGSIMFGILASLIELRLTFIGI